MNYLALRLLRGIATIVAVVTAVFLLVRLVPGDPITAILGDQASPEQQAVLRSQLHLDAPLPEQYALFWGDVLDLSFGTSFRHRDSEVASLIAEVAGPTAELALAAMLLAFAIALPLGMLAAWRRGSRWDKAASNLAIVGLALPNIWLGPLLVLLFSVRLQWLPLPGDDEAPFQSLILPAITLGTALAALLTRQTRAAMAETLDQPYLRVAKAKGLSPGPLLWRHGLRSTLLPVLTVGAAQLGALLSGTVVVEKIFERQGLGSLFLDAFFARDLPVIQGCVLVVAAVYVAINLLTDLLYTALDPRVRLG